MSTQRQPTRTQQRSTRVCENSQQADSLRVVGNMVHSMSQLQQQANTAPIGHVVYPSFLAPGAQVFVPLFTSAPPSGYRLVRTCGHGRDAAAFQCRREYGQSHVSSTTAVGAGIVHQAHSIDFDDQTSNRRNAAQTSDGGSRAASLESDLSELSGHYRSQYSDQCSSMAPLPLKTTSQIAHVSPGTHRHTLAAALGVRGAIAHGVPVKLSNAPNVRASAICGIPGGQTTTLVGPDGAKIPSPTPTSSASKKKIRIPLIDQNGHHFRCEPEQETPSSHVSLPRKARRCKTASKRSASPMRRRDSCTVSTVLTPINVGHPALEASRHHSSLHVSQHFTSASDFLPRDPASNKSIAPLALPSAIPDVQHASLNRMWSMVSGHEQLERVQTCEKGALVSGDAGQLPPFPPSPSMWLNASDIPDAPVSTTAGALTHDQTQAVSELDLFGSGLQSNVGFHGSSMPSGNGGPPGDPYTALHMHTWSSDDSLANLLGDVSAGTGSTVLDSFGDWFGNEQDPLFSNLFASSLGGLRGVVGGGGGGGGMADSGTSPSTFDAISLPQQHQPFHAVSDQTRESLSFPALIVSLEAAQPTTHVNGIFTSPPEPTSVAGADIVLPETSSHSQLAPQKRRRVSPNVAAASLGLAPDPPTSTPTGSDPAPPKKRARRTTTQKRAKVADSSFASTAMVSRAYSTTSLERAQVGMDVEHNQLIFKTTSFPADPLQPHLSRAKMDVSNAIGTASSLVAVLQSAAAKPKTSRSKTMASKGGSDTGGNVASDFESASCAHASAASAANVPAEAQVPDPGRATTISTSRSPVNYHEQAMRIMEMMGLAPTALPAASNRSRSSAGAAAAASSATQPHVQQQQQQPALGAGRQQQDDATALADSGVPLLPQASMTVMVGNSASEFPESLWPSVEGSMGLGMGQSEFA
ncbi:hypothetical protein BCR44DRAFT_81681 [Catenaria anguillulae PL171]|uniref:Uncharacterized protein n=1 Tax=Catenaria anguillulae PL171 TaxID=765915 RepID=A0A1Y2I404_9FUNG|nr:hypothetical protein BCR44DRAFT_81681 [Catenaria anguillulae PL171]